jgi:hypothetical protein
MSQLRKSSSAVSQLNNSVVREGRARRRASEYVAGEATMRGLANGMPRGICAAGSHHQQAGDATDHSHRLLRLYPLSEIHDGVHEGPSIDRLGQVQLKSRLDRVLPVLLSRE